MSATVRFSDVEPKPDRPGIPQWAALPGPAAEVPQIGDEVQLYQDKDNPGHWWRVIRRSHQFSANGVQGIVLGVRFIS